MASSDAVWASAPSPSTTPCSRRMSACARSKVRMNSRPMILRLVSGSVTPASAARNCSSASTITSFAPPVDSPKAFSICADSSWRISPWLTYTQVRRSPMARCTSAAATAESTPPERPQMALPSPTWARIFSTCSSMTLPVVHVGSMPAPRYRKFSSTSWPRSEWPTSGCHCTPNRRRSRSSNAATGLAAEVAMTSQPVGGALTLSPWLIHTFCSRSCPASSVEPASMEVRRVAPYSRTPVGATVPSSAAAIAWKP